MYGLIWKDFLVLRKTLRLYVLFLLGYLGMASSLMDLFSILFLSMMLLKSSPGPNEYGVLPQKITVS